MCSINSLISTITLQGLSLVTSLSNFILAFVIFMEKPVFYVFSRTYFYICFFTLQSMVVNVTISNFFIEVMKSFKTKNKDFYICFSTLQSMVVDAIFFQLFFNWDNEIFLFLCSGNFGWFSFSWRSACVLFTAAVSNSDLFSLYRLILPLTP